MRIGIDLLLVGALMFLGSCASSYPEDHIFETLAGDYVEDYLKMYPEAATELGDHRYDDRLNDYSVAGVKAGIRYQKKYLKLLRRIDPDKLSDVNRVDYYILKNQIEKSIYGLEELKEHEWNPLIYNVGGAIYNLVARDFAPLDERLRNLKSRLEMIPRVTAMAKANLKNPPRVHTETAILRNEGTINLIEKQLDEFVEQVPKMEKQLNEAREKAVGALRYYGSWMENDLLPESKGEFRLGKKRFKMKLRLTLHSDMKMEGILKKAEADLVETQNAMFETALPLVENPHRAGKPDTPEGRKRLIKQVLDSLAESHPTNETIVDKSRQCLEECREFVLRHDLVDVPDEPIELIVMPEFQRGVAVAYCDAPGPLEQEAETFFAISPTPEDWSEERSTSFFREYNDFMLHELTIHEAMPGHYLQLAHANRFEAPTMIRAVFASGPFVEGWATYSEQLMVERGYGGPELKMQQLKMRLRMIINAIIDQKIHAEGMTEGEALALMMNEGFQEEGEAVGKWRRACLTSTQLSTYYVGNIEVNEIRKAYESKYGPAANLKKMHNELLSHGSPPPKYVRELMGL
ncbi:MAG: DUF885 domain-containing protein [Candidatus Latescibacterota bacterium]|nr:MAG: DUF885 domain-containing protein [Candidatus Latescibacterota bacterium]